MRDGIEGRGGIMGVFTREQCEMGMIILVTDHSNDGILARVYAN